LISTSGLAIRLFYRCYNEFVGKLFGFFKGLWRERRIPFRDKAIFALALISIASPIDPIPDWIPFFGQLDDLVLLILLYDYLFQVIATDDLMRHYAWSPGSYRRWRSLGIFLGRFVPNWTRRWLWAYRRVD